MNKKLLVWIAVLSLLMLGISIVINVVLLVSVPFRAMSAWTTQGEFPEVELKAGDADAKVVHIDIEGVINVGSTFMGSDVSETKRRLEAAIADPAVRSIVLRINSPGGEMTASDILYHAVRDAAGKKPVVVYLDAMGASGGYYVACGGSHIMANETTLTGSIGVIIQTLNFEKLLDKVGLQSVVFTSGKFKDMLSPTREMRPEERLYVQQMVTEMYDRFVEIVAEARGIAVEDLKNGVADGRVLTGAGALAERLIDGTGYIEEAYAKAREMGGAPGARIVKYGEDISIGNLLGLLGKADVNRADVQRVRIEVGEQLFPRLQPGAVYLLPVHFAL